MLINPFSAVYFPPLLNVGCDGGQANLTWTNNPENTRIYYSTFYNLNEHIPGRYYIHITCYLHNNILIEVYTSTLFLIRAPSIIIQLFII